MDKKLKQKWIRALRSGKYQQANGVLCNNHNAMCCLGVLAVIQGASLGSIRGQATCNLAFGLNAGLRKKDREKLSYMNDGIGDASSAKNFKEIAAYIKKKL